MSLIENWNNLAHEEDKVYILGDAMLKKNFEDGDFKYGYLYQNNRMKS